MADLAPFLVTHEPWMASGACVGAPANLWFPERGDSTVQAKLVCAGCPVRVECLDFAVRTKEPHGIWGGKTGRELRGLRVVTPRPRPVVNP